MHPTVIPAIAPPESAVDDDFCVSDTAEGEVSCVAVATLSEMPWVAVMRGPEVVDVDVLLAILHRLLMNVTLRAQTSDVLSICPTGEHANPPYVASFAYTITPPNPLWQHQPPTLRVPSAPQNDHESSAHCERPKNTVSWLDSYKGCCQNCHLRSVIECRCTIGAYEISSAPTDSGGQCDL